MKLSVLTSRFRLTGFVLTAAIMPAVVVYGQSVKDGNVPQQGSGTNTVTHNEPSAAGDYWTPERMRQAKPFPMPSIKGSPVPQQVTPNPSTGLSGSSSPGLGGGAPR